MVNFLFVGFGGFIGSVARYLFSQILIFEGLAFPVPTLIVNFIGLYGGLTTFCLKPLV